MIIDTIICSSSFDFILGGAETYVIRIADWTRSCGKRFILLLKESVAIDKSWSEKLSEIEIIRYKVSLTGEIIVPGEITSSIGKTLIISIWFENYLHMLRYSYGHKNIRAIMYILHPFQSSISRKKALNAPYRKVISNILVSNFVFMDEETRDYCSLYYARKIPNENIERVGLQIKDYDCTNFDKRFSQKPFTVISISRMVFPFKEYQIGLLDEMRYVWSINPDVRLIVIGDGKNSEIYQKKLNTMTTEEKNKITWIKNVPYMKLTSYIEKSHVLVGMGTTLLDAAMVGVPGIATMHSTAKAITPGFFYDNINDLGGVSNKKKIGVHQYILETASADIDTYRLMCKKSYNALKSNYDIGVIMESILSKQPQSVNISRAQIIDGEFIRWGQRFQRSRKKIKEKQ